MKLLATFSAEERFRSGSMIFREGEKGDKLYIVLDGRVRISKFIPGVGEEALTVLDRGDFFGEMALIDAMPRSADAKAHEKDTTVLSIDRATLNEILSMDPHASMQFLNLLCRPNDQPTSPRDQRQDRSVEVHVGRILIRFLGPSALFLRADAPVPRFLGQSIDDRDPRRLR